MRLVEIHPKRFFNRRSILFTEAKAYELLKKKPLEAPVTYAAVPWTQLIVERRRLDRAVKLPTDMVDAFTICQHVRFKEILPICRRFNITTVFTPHTDGKMAGGIKLRPFPLNIGATPEPKRRATQGRKYLYSFMGTGNTLLRKHILNWKSRPDRLIQRRRKWHFSMPPREQRECRKAYFQLLDDTRFSLCPAGVGPSTLRLFEGLKFGAVPVVISEGFQPIPGIKWSECVVSIRESQVKHIDRLLGSISPKMEEAKRRAGYEAYELMSGSNIIRSVRLHYDKASA